MGSVSLQRNQLKCDQEEGRKTI